jgi:hypothetical protein
MLRTLTVSRLKPNGQKVQKTFGKSGEAVFGMTELPGAVSDNLFADFVPLCGGKNRYEPMPLAVKSDFVQDFAAVTFHSAVVIVQFHAGHKTDHSVEDVGGKNFVPGIVAALLPTADDIETGLQLPEKVGNLLRIILQVGIECENNVPFDGVETGLQCRRFAEIASKLDTANTGIVGGNFFDDGPTLICRTVVHENYFEIVLIFLGNFANFPVKMYKTLCFVVKRNDKG